jgi:hypothetical protein
MFLGLIAWVGLMLTYHTQNCNKVSDRGNYQITAGLTCSQCQDHGGTGDAGLSAPQFSVHTSKYEKMGEFEVASLIWILTSPYGDSSIQALLPSLAMSPSGHSLHMHYH